MVKQSLVIAWLAALFVAAAATKTQSPASVKEPTVAASKVFTSSTPDSSRQHPPTSTTAPPPASGIQDDSMQFNSSELVLDTLEEEAASGAPVRISLKDKHHYEQQIDFAAAEAAAAAVASESISTDQTSSDKTDARDLFAVPIEASDEQQQQQQVRQQQQFQVQEPQLIADNRQTQMMDASQAAVAETKLVLAAPPIQQQQQQQPVAGNQQQFVYSTVGGQNGNWFVQTSPQPQAQQQQQFAFNQPAQQRPTSINAIISDQQQSQQPQQQLHMQQPPQQLILVSAGSGSQPVRKVSLTNWIRNLTGMLANIFQRQRGEHLSAQSSGQIGQWIQLTSNGNPSATSHWLPSAQTSSVPALQYQQQQQQQQLAGGSIVSRQSQPQSQPQPASTTTTYVQVAGSGQPPLTIAVPAGAQFVQYQSPVIQQPQQLQQQMMTQVSGQQQLQLQDLQTSGSSTSYTTAIKQPTQLQIHPNGAPSTAGNFIPLQPLAQQQQQHATNSSSLSGDKQQPMILSQHQQPAPTTGFRHRSSNTFSQQPAPLVSVQNMPLLHYSRFTSSSRARPATVLPANNDGKLNAADRHEHQQQSQPQQK